VASNRVELCGRLVNQPELRITPAGTAILRLSVECGGEGEELRLDVVMTGEAARDVASRLRAGAEVRVVGTLRAVGRSALRGSRNAIELLASEINPAGK
jgi:single-stranded DNA-binding protein